MLIYFYYLSYLLVERKHKKNPPLMPQGLYSRNFLESPTASHHAIARNIPTEITKKLRKNQLSKKYLFLILVQRVIEYCFEGSFTVDIKYE